MPAFQNQHCLILKLSLLLLKILRWGRYDPEYLSLLFSDDFLAHNHRFSLQYFRSQHFFFFFLVPTPSTSFTFPILLLYFCNCDYFFLLPLPFLYFSGVSNKCCLWVVLQNEVEERVSILWSIEIWIYF